MDASRFIGYEVAPLTVNFCYVRPSSRGTTLLIVEQTNLWRLLDAERRPVRPTCISSDL